MAGVQVGRDKTDVNSVLIRGLPDVATTFSVTTPQAGYVISAYALGVVVGAPLIAVLSAKVPRKGLLLILMLFLHWAICDSFCIQFS